MRSFRSGRKEGKKNETLNEGKTIDIGEELKNERGTFNALVFRFRFRQGFEGVDEKLKAVSARK